MDCPNNARCRVGTSAGKFGPFLAKTQQVFPRDKPGTYINSADLFGGLIRLELFGTYEVGRNHRLDLVFKYVQAFFANLPVRPSIVLLLVQDVDQLRSGSCGAAGSVAARLALGLSADGRQQQQHAVVKQLWVHLLLQFGCIC